MCICNEPTEWTQNVTYIPLNRPTNDSEEYIAQWENWIDEAVKRQLVEAGPAAERVSLETPTLPLPSAFLGAAGDFCLRIMNDAGVKGRALLYLGGMLGLGSCRYLTSALFT